MNCPYCGTEMKKGTLRSRGFQYFLPYGEKDISLYTVRNVEKRGGIMLPPDPEDSGLFFRYGYAWPEAYVCEACRRLEIKY